MIRAKASPTMRPTPGVGHQQSDVLPVVTGLFHRLIEFFDRVAQMVQQRQQFRTASYSNDCLLDGEGFFWCQLRWKALERAEGSDLDLGQRPCRGGAGSSATDRRHPEETPPMTESRAIYLVSRSAVCRRHSSTVQPDWRIL